jgi:hypothetical protein
MKGPHSGAYKSFGLAFVHITVNAQNLFIFYFIKRSLGLLYYWFIIIKIIFLHSRQLFQSFNWNSIYHVTHVDFERGLEFR